MIQEVGYTNNNGFLEAEFKCRKINEYDLSSPVITTQWCINKCPFALKCAMVENMIRKEDTYGVEEYKKMFVALRYMLEDLDISEPTAS